MNLGLAPMKTINLNTGEVELIVLKIVASKE